MADFTDVIAEASPALVRAKWEVTEGKSWRTSILIPADLTGVSGTAVAMSKVDGSVVVTFSVDVDVIDSDWSSVTLTAEPSNTAGTAGSGSQRKRVCPMYLTLNKGSEKADVFGVQESYLIISQGA